MQLVCRYRLLNCGLITSWMVPPLFSLDDVVFLISRKNFKFWLIWPQNNYHFASVELWLRKDSSISGLCLHMASSLHDRALTCICAWHGELGSQNYFWRCSWSHVVISVTESCLFLMQCCLKAWGSQTSRIFGLVPCTQRSLQSLWIFWWYYVL